MALTLRHSIAPRIVSSSIPTGTLHSNARFSVRITPPTSSKSILTTFVWRDRGANVYLAGSFGDWGKHQMTYIPDIKYHILVVELPPGEYFYRFVVDGCWRVVDDDSNLRRDEFGEMSHYLNITPESLHDVTVKRFSSAFVADAGDVQVADNDVCVDSGEHSELDDDEIENEQPLPHNNGEEYSADYDEPPLPRNKGKEYVADYDDDACGELDLQADVFEAMKDVAEKTNSEPMMDSTSSVSQTQPRKKRARKPGRVMLRRIWAMLFKEPQPEITDEEKRRTLTPTHNQRIHGLANKNNGIKIWFPNETNFPKQHNPRKVQPQETEQVIDVQEKALKLHQVEDNANTRQMLGKNMFAQGKFDAALALFSLSVKLREDNGLKYAKTTAIAHTDVASAFIHLDDLQNAEKHLNMALAIFQKNTFSGGRAQLADVHCFLGVVGDMKGDLRVAEIAYRNAISIYEEGKATSSPNYSTAKENLAANIQRQKFAPAQPAVIVTEPTRAPEPKQPPMETPNHYQAAYHHQSDQPDRNTNPLHGNRPSPQPVTLPPPLAPPQRPVRRPLEASKPAPRVDSAVLAPSSVANGVPRQSSRESGLAQPQTKRRPSTWKGLADTARASMPVAPPREENVSDEEESPGGIYEEMCREWHREARELLGKGEYKEAIDMYTLAIYKRKINGPWNTRDNAEALVENARALFATKQLDESVNHLKDAVEILERFKKQNHRMFLGEVWGNLGSVLDRIDGRSAEALSAHCAGMVVYGRAGMATDDAKWLKAWKSLCINLKKSNQADRTDEIWQNIDLQIRGVTPMAKVSNVILRR